MAASRRLRSMIAAGLGCALLVGGCAAAAPPSGPPASRDPVAPSMAVATPSDAPEHVTAPPGPSAPPVPTLSATFTSPTMGYSVRYPSGWKPTPASEPWAPGDQDFWDMPNGDRIESADAGFRGGSQPLLPGQTADAWMHAYLGDVDPDCGGWEQIPLGGATATINLNGCHGLGRLGGRVYDVVVVVGDRAYNFTMEGAVDRNWLDAFLGSVTFEPEKATDRRTP